MKVIRVVCFLCVPLWSAMHLTSFSQKKKVKINLAAFTTFIHVSDSIWICATPLSLECIVFSSLFLIKRICDLFSFFLWFWNVFFTCLFFLSLGVCLIYMNCYYNALESLDLNCKYHPFLSMENCRTHSLVF